MKTERTRIGCSLIDHESVRKAFGSVGSVLVFGSIASSASVTPSVT